MINSEGPKNPLFIICGGVPDQYDLLTGKPFAGPAGGILNSKLHSSEIPRQSCYVTLVSKEKIQESSLWLKKGVPSNKLKELGQKLLEEIDTIDSTTILALGDIAFMALTGRSKLSKLRGSIYKVVLPSGKEINVIGSYDPKEIIKMWENGAILSFDIAKAKSVALLWPENFVIPKRNLLIRPSKQEVISFIKGCVVERVISFDIETSSNGITCISFASNIHSAISIPTTVEYWKTTQDLLEVLKWVSWGLKSDTVKIGQNILFDLQYIIRFFNILPTLPWQDTMVAHHTCYSELPKGLDFLTSIYTNEPYYKDELKVWNTDVSNMDLLWTYNAKDAVVTLEVWQELEKEMESLGVRDTYDFTTSLYEPILTMMLRGLKVDPNKMKEYRQKYESLIEIHTKKFSEKFGGVSPTSPKQLAELAYKTLKLKPVIKDGKPTMNEKAITKLAIKSPVLREVLEIRQNSKVLSTYINTQMDPIDGRLKFSLNPAGTVTGRFSSSRSSFWCGTNIQNFPKKIRDMVVPDHGMYFSEADLVGAEAMVMAYLTSDPILIDIFERGANVHIFTATKIIWPGLTEEEVLEDKKICEEEDRHTKSKYFIAKKVRHGGNYLFSEKGIAEELEMELKEAKALLRRFFDNSPNLTRYHYFLEKELYSKRVIVSPLGRKRIFFGRVGKPMLREAVAFPPQDTVTRVLNIGIKRIYKELCSRYKHVNLCAPVHDSILLQHPKEMTNFIHEKLKTLMSVDLEINKRRFKIGVDVQSGVNWRDLCDE